MNIKTVFTVLITVMFTTAVAGVGYYFYFLLAPQLTRDTPTVTVTDPLFGWKFPVTKFPLTGSGGSLAYSDIRDPGGIPQGLPVRLKVPAIGVDSAIEDAFITPDGRMDVPAGSKNVAWFALGPHPGQVGSAVIGGHFGITNGVPFVFYDLDKLRVGDQIYIVDDKGNTLTFVVRDIRLFDRDADATEVFTSSDGLAHLNLITCEGIWNRVNDTYPDRRVIFTDVVPSGSPVAPAIPAFYRSLDIGATGTDVTALQTILVQKGLLTIPPEVSYGYFGMLTRAAVTNYQTSVGLPMAGTFGPLTRAKLISELTVVEVDSPTTVQPTLPSTAIPTPESSFSFQLLLQYAKNLFATPLDASITLLLLVTIGVVVFKIIRR